MDRWLIFSAVLLTTAVLSPAQEEMHDHGVPEVLGTVSFPVSCAPVVQPQFNRAVALLHSFAYAAALKAFQDVAAQDPGCAMAHWGEAMTYYHPVWPQPLPEATFAEGEKEILSAEKIGSKNDRERQFIHALSLIYVDDEDRTYTARAEKYEQAMAALAESNRSDIESQVFYALALLGSASSTDKTHARQKKAIDLLLPIYHAYPDHPGVAHYLIHACDNQELALRGLAVARAYAKIAPSVPHALHMPSHIFTQLGLWEDSIRSNLASRHVAEMQGNMQGILHDDDYLVYAYLQLGRDAEAEQVIDSLKTMPKLDMSNFNIAYAATAMPIRLWIERGQWAQAATAVPLPDSPPEVSALAVWCRGLGLAHIGKAIEARAEGDKLREIADRLHSDGNDYWSTQTMVLAGEVMAWSAQGSGRPVEAAALLRSSADQEDAVEKLPVTPGSILPAREQLGDLLLEQKQAAAAHKEFQAALAVAPGRLGAVRGLATTSGTSGEKK
jgi:tetratricopeptide (TPR) repeat protein